MISAVTLGFKTHKRLATIVVSVCDPVSVWQGQHVKLCKHVQKNHKWLLVQLKGDCMLVCSEVLDTVANTDVMGKASVLEFAFVVSSMSFCVATNWTVTLLKDHCDRR